MEISGYVPFFNAASTVLASVDSLRNQDPPLAEVFAIDDGSTDGGAALLENAGVRVLRQPSNLGRGAARRKAMNEAAHELVLCCDATNMLPANFSKNARPWFNDPNVAAVFGLITDPSPKGAVGRWRARHLFKAEAEHPVSHHASLITFGTMVRATHVEVVGGFNTTLRHSEDIDLGERLLKAGFDVIGDSSLPVITNVQNSVAQVLERYWRWYAGKEERFGLEAFFRSAWSSFRTMALNDLRKGDPMAACISMLLPHYQMWKFLSKPKTRP